MLEFGHDNAAFPVVLGNADILDDLHRCLPE